MRPCRHHRPLVSVRPKARPTAIETAKKTATESDSPHRQSGTLCCDTSPYGCLLRRSLRSPPRSTATPTRCPPCARSAACVCSANSRASGRGGSRGRATGTQRADRARRLGKRSHLQRSADGNGGQSWCRVLHRRARPHPRWRAVVPERAVGETSPLDQRDARG